jgi:hypothetical protein
MRAFATITVWEQRVQLCTDLIRMPVEDASVEWDEHLSPSLTYCKGHCSYLKMRIRIPAEYGLTSSLALTLGIVWPRIAPSANIMRAPGSRHTKRPVTFAIAQRDARWLSLDPSKKCPTRCSRVSFKSKGKALCGLFG